MNTGQPTLGIAIPIGDWSPLFARSLASLKLQNYPIKIAVLDASADPRVKQDLEASGLDFDYIREGQDAGQTAAISEGWENLDTDILAWLNTDDILLAGVLEDVARVFRDNPDIDVYYGQSTISDKDGRIIGLHPEVSPPSELILRSNIISQPSCFVRRQAVRDVGGLNNSLDYTMDWDLWVRLYKAGKHFAHTPRVLSNVTWGFETKTSKFNKKRIAELLRVVRMSNGPWRVSKSIFGFFLHYLRTYFQIGKRDNVRPSYHTPLNGELTLPIINFAKTPSARIQLNLVGDVCENVSVSYLGKTIVLSSADMVLDLPAPVEPGHHVELIIKTPANDRVEFARAFWL